MIGSISRIINQWTLRSVRRGFDPYVTIKSGQADPVLISGIFRSGTSITAKILTSAGLDPGPEKHLLQATGKFRNYNPDGFMENYFFMELSRFLFYLTNSSGDSPPSPSEVEKIVLSSKQDDAFRSYALMELREQRISNRNKAEVLKKVSLEHPKAYLSHVFGAKPLIKNPHFSVLEPYFGKLFPDSIRVVVFRDPNDWLRSAGAVTPKADVALFDRYYRYYLDRKLPNVIFFDYDRLLENPKKSIEQLFNGLHLQAGAVNPETLIRKPAAAKQEAKSKTNSLSWPELLELAINR